ncbi:MAG: hypothetical protein NUV77_02800, partial [Thermoguttaceae bacterium]|nr:hypothetical protein [Thermoguttaceae bacterium]
PGPHQLWLAVLSGRSGKVRWTHALGKPYHKPDTPWAGQTRPFTVDQVAPGVALADLDRDGVSDIVAVAEAEDPATSPALELRAVRGTDGQLLWRCPLPAAMTGDVYGLYRNAPVPVAADLDGDGHAEIVFLEFENVPERGGIQRFARVRALDGGSGKPLWSHQTPVSINAGNIAANHLALLVRPMATVLRVARSPHPHIAVNLWGRPCEILVLDHAGKPVARYPAKDQADEFRFWATDCDGDGGDEIVMLRDRKLQAFRPESPEKPLWTADVPATWGTQILGIHGQQPGPRVVYRNERRVYGIDGATGAVVWTCDGPRPVHQQALLMVDATVLDPRAAAPNVLFSYNFVSAFRQAARAGRGDLPEARVPPRLDGAEHEPRLTRRLPWATDGRVFVRRELYLFGWASFYAVTLLVVPSLWIGWLVWRRRWSLRAMLMFPLVVLLILPGGLVEGPNPPFPQYSDSLGGRMTSGMFVMPLLFVPAYSAFLAHRRRWRALAVWLAVFAAICGVAAGVAIYVDSSRASEITVYSWEGWYWIALPGIYITGCVMLFWTALLLVIGAARGLVRRFRGRRPWPTPSNATQDA